MDRLPEENGDDPQGLTRQAAPPRPGGGAQDAMALLRQASQYHQAKQGNVSTPEIEANKQAMAANSEAIHALKYSVHGIPEGINHVDELERLKGLINTNQATANDLDNFITLEQFMKDQTARTNGEMGGSSGSELHGSDGAIGAGVPHSEGASAGAASAQAAPAPVPSRRNVQSGGSNGPVSRPHVSGVGEVQAPAPVQRPGMEGRNGRQTSPKADAKPAAKPAIEPPKKRELIKPTPMKTIAGRDTGKTNEQGMRVIGAPEGTVKPYQAPPAKRKVEGGRDTGKTNEQGMRVIGAPEGTVKPYQAPPAKREPSRLKATAKVAAREMRNLSPEERAQFAATGISPLNGEGWDQAKYNGPFKSAEEMRDVMGSRARIEREGQVGSPEFMAAAVPLMLGAAGAYGMSKAGPKITKAGQQMSAAMETADAVRNRPRAQPAVNNNISRVSRPPGLQLSGAEVESHLPSSGSSSVPSNVRKGASGAGVTAAPPKRTEGYSVNTQTPAAQKRNSMSKSQRAADANKKGAAEAKTEKTAGKPKAPKTEKIADKPKRPKK